MKVRVLKEMPGANIGDIYDIEDYKYVQTVIGCHYKLEDAFKDGWIEEIKDPKSFEHQTKETFKRINHLSLSSDKALNIISKNFARDAKEYYLEVFDEIKEKTKKDYISGLCFCDILNNIRKAIENA